MSEFSDKNYESESLTETLQSHTTETQVNKNQQKSTWSRAKTITVVSVSVLLTLTVIGGVYCAFHFGLFENHTPDSPATQDYAVTHVSRAQAPQTLFASNSCSSTVHKDASHVPEPMPHQVILCEDKAEDKDRFDASKCQSDYKILSLYNPKYLMDNETLNMLGNGLDFHNVHAYMQGKYIMTYMTETKTDQSDKSKAIDSAASFAVTEAEDEAKSEAEDMGGCAAMEAAAGGFPVCGTLKFIHDIFKSLFPNFSQNNPSSQAGKHSTYFDHRGLGGNINTIVMQMYDPYNFPSVTIWEWDDCEGESATYGVRSFERSGDQITEIQSGQISVDTPAEDGNSFYLPYNTKLELIHRGEVKATLTCDWDVEGCGCQHLENRRHKEENIRFDKI